MKSRRQIPRPRPPTVPPWVHRLPGSAFRAVLWVTAVAAGLQMGLRWLGAHVEVDLVGALSTMATAHGLDPVALRLGVFSALHVVVLRFVWGPLKALDRAGRRGCAWMGQQVRRLSRRAAVGLHVGFALGVFGVLALLGIQPTLVPLKIDRQSWLERGANFVDGSASVSVADAVASLAWAVQPLPPEPVAIPAAFGPEVFDAGLDSDEIPLMDRWDPILAQATNGDQVLFAQVKAFMWVESGGRQFALSATGCAGLMQFCASTAQRPPFHAVFGVGQVTACGCRDCSVSREVTVALETDPMAVVAHADAFPCNLSDARFRGDRAIRAAVLYVQELSRAVDGNLPLMYVGYNAGPRVAKVLHADLGGDVTLEELRPHLVGALRPYYGDAAVGRARGLSEVHLPKLMAAHRRWR